MHPTEERIEANTRVNIDFPTGIPSHTSSQSISSSIGFTSSYISVSVSSSYSISPYNLVPGHIRAPKKP